MYPRLLHLPDDPKQSIFLLGPRGTGKTAWLREHFPNALYFDLLEDETYRELLANPGVLAQRIPPDYEGRIVIDEVQKAPALLNEVHRLIEKGRGGFILTGSSARSLKRKGINLLAGRALTYYMHPLTTHELTKDFDLARALQWGTLPAVCTHKMPKKYLSTYITTYIREEVIQEGLIRQLPLFHRFLETASFSQGEVINYANIAREVGTSRQTITNYFDLLEDLLLANRLMVFDKRAKRAVITHPKFYFFDVGVYRSLRPKGPLDHTEELDGAALETLFLQEARAINDYEDLGYCFYYWRTQTQQEVDFIIYGERGLHAFEIKRKRKLSHNDFKGLAVFSEDYPMAQCTLLYGGDRLYYEGRIQALPFQQGLLGLRDRLSGSEK